MDNSDKMTLQLAEKICKRKFDQKFGENCHLRLDENSVIRMYKEQIDLWKELGKTHLSVKEVEELPPISQGLYYLCKDKIKFCMDKLLLL